MGQRERGAGDMTAAPGLALLPRQGPPRLLGRSLLEHLGLDALPPFVESAGELLELAGFHPQEGEPGLWERNGVLVHAGECPLEDEARLVWTWALPEQASELTQRQVRYLSLAS